MEIQGVTSKSMPLLQPITNITAVPGSFEIPPSFVSKAVRMAYRIANSLEKWDAELRVLYTVPSRTPAQLARINKLEWAIQEYEGYFRDGGALPTSEWIAAANKPPLSEDYSHNGCNVLDLLKVGSNDE